MRLLSLLIPMLLFFSCQSHHSPTPRPPNIVLIFCDDLGYADVPGFGPGPACPMPNLDRLAKQGQSLTNFHVAQAVCSASRCALMTGCFPNRLGISGALGPKSKTGLNPDEEILPECLKPAGYHSAIFGKWHLGDAPAFLPCAQGFERWTGIPYSNDMSPYRYGETSNSGHPPLYLFEDDKPLRELASIQDQEALTGLLTQRTCEFIRTHKSEPFFVYLPHPMPHTPIVASKPFQGLGPKAIDDTLREIDASVGSILDTLEELKLADNTIVIFTSDNGPWRNFGEWAGSCAPLREGKGTSFEGGVRVPCLIKWPGVTRPGSRNDKLAATIDLLPSLVQAAGGRLPEKTIDGQDIRALLADPSLPSPHASYPVYYRKNHLEAITDGRFKLVFPHVSRSYQGVAPGRNNQPGKYAEVNQPLALYDLAEDIGETRDVQDRHPEVMARLQQAAAEWRRRLGDKGKPGSENRAPGKL